MTHSIYAIHQLSYSITQLIHVCYLHTAGNILFHQSTVRLKHQFIAHRGFAEASGDDDFNHV